MGAEDTCLWGMRRGGAVTVFLRMDEKPIRRSCGIYEPDAIVVLDPALIKVEGTGRGLRREASPY